jgi:RNA polymerase sigma factor (TIGR02999 family)
MSTSASIPGPEDLTRLLNLMLRGDQAAGDQAMDALYGTLRRVASNRMRGERAGHLLETRALVNEAMLRLFGSQRLTVRNRQHFYALACLTMRRVLIDRGRRGEPVFDALDGAMADLQRRDAAVAVDFDRILGRLADLDPQASQTFALRVGLGMTADEAADEMGCSTPSVNRYLQRARVWLFKELLPYLDAMPARSPRPDGS